MIAAWMLYCALCALGLSLAAALAERVLLAGRDPVRHVWLGALALSLLLPAAALYVAPRVGAEAADVDEVNAAVGRDGLPDPRGSMDLRGSVVAQASSATPLVDARRPAASAPIVTRTRVPRSRDSNWKATLSRFWQPALSHLERPPLLAQTLTRADRPLVIAWAALSSLLALYFLGGIAALAVMRRGWRRRVVLGVPVLVSEETGPALVGTVSPMIVLPEWALALEPPQLALMLRHEQEHRRARDGQLLTAAQLALVAMPWNAALWWQLARLRAAVELDCDARVLRDADARSYGDLLLEVVRPRRGLRLLGATAFAERATQLERRIRVMTRRRGRSDGEMPRRARVIAASIAFSTVTAAWVVPRPPVPTRAARMVPSSSESNARSATACHPAGASGASECRDRAAGRDPDISARNTIPTLARSTSTRLTAGTRLLRDDNRLRRADAPSAAQPQRVELPGNANTAPVPRFAEPGQPLSRHARASGHPCEGGDSWMPACAGMTSFGDIPRSRSNNAPRPRSDLATGRGASPAVLADQVKIALLQLKITLLLRNGTAGIVNPMLMMLRDADSIGLSAKQADSIATMNRAYMVRLSAIWSPVASDYAARRPTAAARPMSDDRYSRATEATVDLLIGLVPRIDALLTAEQRGRLPPWTAAYLNPLNLAAVRAGNASALGVYAPAVGVFAPLGGIGPARGGGRGSRARGSVGGM